MNSHSREPTEDGDEEQHSHGVLSTKESLCRRAEAGDSELPTGLRLGGLCCCGGRRRVTCPVRVGANHTRGIDGLGKNEETVIVFQP